MASAVEDPSAEGWAMPPDPPFAVALAVWSETGQTVVETGTTLVTVAVVFDSAGQSAALSAQAVTVAVWVEKMVEVVISVVVGEAPVGWPAVASAVESPVAEAVWSETGQMVVETATTLVSVLVVWDSAGQSATSTAQAVTVAVWVEKTVEVVSCTGVVAAAVPFT